jgi:hypothetical protein
MIPMDLSWKWTSKKGDGMKKGLVSMLFLGLLALIASSCKNDPVSANDDDNRPDTSIFIGTWYEIFDTSDIPLGTKDEKIMYWFMGGTRKGERIMNFPSDSDFNVGAFDYKYRYSSDSIYIFQTVSSQTVPEFSYGYKIWGKDSLFLDPKETGYNPLYVRR